MNKDDITLHGVELLVCSAVLVSPGGSLTTVCINKLAPIVSYYTYSVKLPPGDTRTPEQTRSCMWGSTHYGISWKVLEYPIIHTIVKLPPAASGHKNTPGEHTLWNLMETGNVVSLKFKVFSV